MSKANRTTVKIDGIKGPFSERKIVWGHLGMALILSSPLSQPNPMAYIYTAPKAPERKAHSRTTGAQVHSGPSVC